MAFRTPHQLDWSSTSIDLDYWEQGWGQCDTRDVDLPDVPGRWVIRKGDIFSIAQPASFLGFAPSHDEQVNELMDRLEAISPAIASCHGRRSHVLQNLRFRLIAPGEEQRKEGPHERSYIALSYRWTKNETLSPGTVASPSSSQVPGAEHEKNGAYDIYTNSPVVSSDDAPAELAELPIPPPFYKALLDERISEHEGIWIDQLCINQDDELEKSVAVPAMDLVYGRARVVVVILGDIGIDQAEIEALENIIIINEQNKAASELQAMATAIRNLTDQPLEIEPTEPLAVPTHFTPAVNTLAHKILSAEWFKRAWCNHEFRMSRRHIFLIQSESATRPRVVRFTGSFLYHLLRHFDSTNLSYHEFLTEIAASSYLMRLDSAARGHINGGNTAGERWLRAYLNIFPLSAGGDPKIEDEGLRSQNAARDKYSIVLNTVGKGIYYTGGETSEENFYRNLMAIALAARDPTALCTSGEWVRRGHRRSWIQRPIEADLGDGKPETLYEHPPMPISRISFDPSGEFRWISLDLSILNRFGSGKFMERAYRTRTLQWADMFIKTCTELNIPLIEEFSGMAELVDLSYFPQLSTINPAAFNQVSPILQGLFYLTIFYCVALGKEWIARMFIPLKESESALKEREAAISALDEFSLDDSVDRTRAYLMQPAGRTAANRIMKLITGIVIAGVPFSSLFLNSQPVHAGGNPTFWFPIIFQLDSGRQLMVYVPDDLSNESGPDLAIAVPTALLSDEYRGLCRVWLLKKFDKDGVQCWKLVDKTRLLGDIRNLSEEPGLMNLTGQRIYGDEE